MGISCDWKSILKDEYGAIENKLDPKFHENVDIVIDDIEIAIYSLTAGVKTWSEIYNRCCTRLNAFMGTFFIMSTLVLLFDESEFVPINKQIEQLDRKTKSKTIPLTEDELNSLVIKNDDRAIPSENTQEFIKKVISNRKAKRKLFAFLIHAIVTNKWKRDIKIIIDGAYMEYLLEDPSLKGILHFIDCKVDGKQKYVTVDYQYNTKRANITVQDSTRIGEADLKMIKHIDDYKNSNRENRRYVFVKSKDTDCIGILLIHCRDWIDKITGNVEFSIMLDLTPTENKSEYMDILPLRKKIINQFFTKGLEHIPSPIETMVLLMFLSGSDYCIPFKQLSSKIVWHAFKDRGHCILFEKEEMDEMDVGKYPKRAIVSVGYDFGEPSKRHVIAIDEQSIYDFIMYCYSKSLSKKDLIVERTSNDVRKHAVYNDNKYVNSPTAISKMYNIPNDEEIKARIRMIWWQIDYWTNGNKAIPFFNPIAEMSNKSCFGWISIDNKIIQSKSVIEISELKVKSKHSDNKNQRRESLSVNMKHSNVHQTKRM